MFCTSKPKVLVIEPVYLLRGSDRFLITELILYLVGDSYKKFTFEVQTETVLLLYYFTTILATLKPTFIFFIVSEESRLRFHNLLRTCERG